MRRTLLKASLAIGLGLALGVGGAVWWKLTRPGEQTFADDLERFKYGSLGAERRAGVPYPVFFVMPRAFPDLLPTHGGWGAFGPAWEQGERLPIGLSIKRLGYERVTANCAFCHTTTYRLTAEENPRFAPGGPGSRLRVQRMIVFMVEAAHDRRFASARLLPEIAVHFKFDWLDPFIFKYGLIPQERRRLRELGRRTAWFASAPPWDAGRAQLLALDQIADGQLVPTEALGASDIPGLWGLDEDPAFWGGEAATPRVALATCARVVGAPPGDAFDRTADWLAGVMTGLTPPVFPDPFDAVLVERGRGVFAGACASCHAREGQRSGTIVPLAEIGTDPERARAGGSDGYLARPLTGVWLLGPYLHNGSVPTVRDLLEPPERRPAAFFRGYDLIDTADVGFVSEGGEAARLGERYDIGVPGNDNGGHLWGTDLPEADKRALLEFLKTL